MGIQQPSFYHPNIDELVKSQKVSFRVIPAKAGIKLNPLTLPLSPANGGEGGGEGRRIKKEIPIHSSYFKYLKILWTPVSTGVTTFYEIINIPVFHFSIIPFPLAFPYFLCVLCVLCGERFLGEKT